MKIKWFGHSCFLLTSEAGVKVLTDPFDNKVGYAVPRVETDIVTISHGHFDHNNKSMAKGKFTCFDSPGKYFEKGLEIQGIPTLHDNEGGTKRGKNIVFKFAIDGIRVCHCGDLGHIPTREQVEELKGVDVLLIPVGGVFTIDYKDAYETVKLLKPVITVPMHFKTQQVTFELDTVDRFLDLAGQPVRTGSTELELKKEDLGKTSGVVLLNYK
ncbi:MAG: MBL fold metallo-hydrolase [Clostridiales bacterium]|jgi:L-ascorbate metabolism protein UlaG (beta-lactamase superfamily)|nr:MBL fold metallo-hydrolase [Eubacteriales bacterium]MDH7566461.1 MBL fold metallo-hydrolase [Clostridiales bacterium]